MATLRVWERWRLDSGAQHAILSRRSTGAPGRAERTARGRPSRDAPALHIDPRAVLHPTLVRGVPMWPLTRICLAALCIPPLISLVAQEPRGVLVPVGARVKAESAQSGKTTEGTVLAWRGDTLVMRAEGGDTVRIPAAALMKLRISESPTVWRHTRSTDSTYVFSVAVP